MGNSVVVNKSYDFSVKIVKFCFEMQNTKKEYVISRQLLRSGTSVGANIEEAQGAISKAEFIAKMQIALKEIKETKYWLRLIEDARVFKHENSEHLLIAAGELILLLTSILKTAKERK